MESADRSVQNAAGQNANNAGATASNYGAQAGQISNTLLPTLKAEATGNIGLTPLQQSNELTAGAQGAGGATGSLMGEAGLNAERTNNSGSTAGIFDQVARRNAQTLSNQGLNVQNESAKLAQQKQAQALSQLQGLYGTDVSSQLKGMGLQNEDLDTDINAGKSGWFQNGLGLLGSLQGAGKTASGFTL